MEGSGLTPNGSEGGSENSPQAAKLAKPRQVSLIRLLVFFIAPSIQNVILGPMGPVQRRRSGSQLQSNLVWWSQLGFQDHLETMTPRFQASCISSIEGTLRGRTILNPRNRALVWNHRLFGNCGSMFFQTSFDPCRQALRRRSSSSSQDPPRTTRGYCVTGLLKGWATTELSDEFLSVA